MPARVFARRQPQPTRELPRRVETRGCAPRCRRGPSRSTAPTPGIVRNRVTTGSASARARSSRSRSAMRVSMARTSSWTLVRIVAQVLRQQRRPPLPGIVGTACSAARAPAGSSIPCSRKMPRSVLIRAVRVVIHCSRTRCSATSACCSTRFTGHARHLARAHGLQDRFRIRAIRFVTTDIRPHVGRRHESHAVPVLLCDASPIVRHATRLHHDVRRGCLGEEAGELCPIEPLTRRRCASAHSRSPTRTPTLRGRRPLS